METLKILQVVCFFPPHIGGQEKYVHSLSRNLIQMGHEVNIATSSDQGKTSREIFDGMDVIRYGCIGSPLRNPITPGMIDIAHLGRDYDLVHVHNEHTIGAIIVANAKKKLPPSIITCHGQVKYGNGIKDVAVGLYDRTFGKYIFNQFDRIVSLSESDKKRIARFGVDTEKIVILPNAIELGPNEATNEKGKYVISPYKKSSAEKTILFIGACTRRKGVEYLLRSMPNVIEAAPTKVTLLMVGNGPYLDEAKYLVEQLNIADSVKFLGFVDSDRLIELYRSSDIFVLPSLSEGMPTVILEAMHYGLPVVATDIEGIRDYFHDSAVLIPSRDEISLADGLLKLLCDSDLAANLASKGKTLVDSTFTWRQVTNNYNKIYHSMVSLI